MEQELNTRATQEDIDRRVLASLTIEDPSTHPVDQVYPTSPEGTKVVICSQQLRYSLLWNKCFNN